MFGYEKENDYHCWVVNKDDEVVFDPDFSAHESIRKTRGCLYGSQAITHREEYPRHRQRAIWQVYKTEKHRETPKQVRDYLKQNGATHGYCQRNCISFIKGKKGLRIAIGFLGWERKDGSVWWEYGWDDERSHL